jgi:hypothetical protein
LWLPTRKRRGVLTGAAETKLTEKNFLDHTLLQCSESGVQRPRVLGTPEGDDWRLFKPRIDDDGTAYESLRQLLKLEKSEALVQLYELIRQYSAPRPHALRIKVAAALLRDLMQMGWEFHIDSHWISVRPRRLQAPQTVRLAFASNYFWTGRSTFRIFKSAFPFLIGEALQILLLKACHRFDSRWSKTVRAN